MPLLSGEQGEQKAPEVIGGTSRDSRISGRVLDDWAFSFFAQLHMSPSTVREYRREENGSHITSLFDVDGACARVADEPDGSGVRVQATGPRDLWAPIERAHEQWLALNRPRREWFTMTASPDGQAVAYTDPSGQVHPWAL